MEKHGGGLGMTAAMQQPVDYGAYYRKAKVERDRARAQKEREDREFAIKLRADQARMDAEYAPKLKRVQRNLQWWSDKRQISDLRWQKIQRRASKPCFGLEMTTARAEAEAEATAPVDQGILGLGILSTIRNRLAQITEQSERERGKG